MNKHEEHPLNVYLTNIGDHLATLYHRIERLEEAFKVLAQLEQTRHEQQ